MARPDKSTIFDRKLQELQQESEKLDDNIKSLSKAIRKIETTGELPAAPAPRSTPRFGRNSGAAQQKVPDMLQERPYADIEEAELRVPFPPAEPVAETPASSADGELFPGFKSAAPDGKKKPISDTKQFASYLASGSFGKTSRPLSQEKKLQRNKAIFMLVFALLAAFVVFRMIF